MERKILRAMLKEAWAMLKYWSNFDYGEDESGKMTTVSELRFWRKQVTEAREEIKKWGVYYLIQEPMVILFQFLMFVVLWGIHIYVFSILWPVLNYAEWFGWLFWPLSLLCIVPGMYTGYRLACAVDMLVVRRYIAKCDDILSRIDCCEKSL